MNKFLKTRQILTALAGATLATLEILDEALLIKGSVYRSRRLDDAVRDFNATDLQRFYSVLSRLRHDGLVLKRKTTKGIFWKITSLGLNKLKILEEKKIDYESESDNKLKIVMFDIPERDRKKRAWLREVLGVVGFKMLQQSVWVGKNKIPEEFLIDLRRKGLMPYIHILEVTKSGTIKELN